MKLITLTKPGIIIGNLITASGGYFFALSSLSELNFAHFLLMLLAVGLVIASGCVFNNYIDRDIDPLMSRTKNRPSAQKLYSGRFLLCYALLLGLCAGLVFYYGINPLSLWMALLGWFFYVVVYSLWLKRRSVHSTFVGAVSGAMPPVIGYCAVTNHLDLGALLLFLILFVWQMPHSYAIGIFRLSDYQTAKIPLLPVVKGVAYTKRQMCCYTVLFAVAVFLPVVFHLQGVFYGAVAGLIALYGLVLTVQGCTLKAQTNSRIWARKLFFYSIISIMLLSFAMAVKF